MSQTLIQSYIEEIRKHEAHKEQLLLQIEKITMQLWECEHSKSLQAQLHNQKHYTDLVGILVNNSKKTRRKNDDGMFKSSELFLIDRIEKLEEEARRREGTLAYLQSKVPVEKSKKAPDA